MTDNKTLNSLYQELENYKNFDANPENCEKFLDVVDQIVLIKNPKSLLILFKYFDDSSEYTWVMESLRCAIETYPDDVYVEKFLESFDIIWGTASEWTEYLLYPILNSKEAFLILKKLINKKHPEKILILFNKIQLESPHHAELIDELKHELDQKNLK